MWKKFLELLSRVISLGHQVERHDKQIEEMRQELRDLTLLYERHTKNRIA